MAGFNKPKATFQKPTGAFNESPKEQYLRIFKSLLMLLIRKGHSVDDLIAFTKKPNLSDLYPDDVNSQISATSYTGIMKFTTLDERKNIFVELEEAGEIK